MQYFKICKVFIDSSPELSWFVIAFIYLFPPNQWKSHIWLTSHRYPTPDLNSALITFLPWWSELHKSSDPKINISLSTFVPNKIRFQTGHLLNTCCLSNYVIASVRIIWQTLRCDSMQINQKNNFVERNVFSSLMCWTHWRSRFYLWFTQKVSQVSEKLMVLLPPVSREHLELTESLYYMLEWSMKSCLE